MKIVVELSKKDFETLRDILSVNLGYDLDDTDIVKELFYVDCGRDGVVDLRNKVKVTIHAKEEGA